MIDAMKKVEKQELELGVLRLRLRISSSETEVVKSEVLTPLTVIKVSRSNHRKSLSYFTPF